jgi:hypothetical protein
MLIISNSSKTSWVLKVTILGYFFPFFLHFYYIKSPFSGKILHAIGRCQVISLLKIATFGFMKLLIAVESKFKNDASTSPSVKK